MNIHFRLFCILQITFFFAIPTLCYCLTADYIILHAPEQFSITDKYEQPLDKPQKKALLPNAVLRIEKADDIMGDQISHAMRCLYNGTLVFLLKNEDGELIGDQKTNRQIIKGCTVVNDTVVVKNQVTLFSDVTCKTGTSLKKGDVVFRLFSRDKSICCFVTGSKPRFGFCLTKDANAFSTITSHIETAPDTLLSPLLIKAITTRIDSANAAYTHLFGHFATTTHQDKKVARWERDMSSQSLRFFLNNPYAANGQLEQSTRYLKNDIEGMLIGKPFFVGGAGGEILIEAKQK